jgi:hypothetical protein
MTEADLYLQMWRATKDPKYIRLFREAIAEQASVARYSMEKRLSRRVEKVEGMTYLEMTRRNLIALGIATPQQLPPFPDGKTYTLEEILEELE